MTSADRTGTTTGAAAVTGDDAARPPRAVPSRPHADPGLQPERTAMSWGRTLLAMFVVASMLLRWLPQFGPVVVVPAGAAVLVAAAIHTTQRRRYRRMARIIRAEAGHADAVSVTCTAAAVIVLGALGIVAVLGA